MLYKIKLKNADKFLILEDFVFEWLSNDPYYSEIKMLENVRLHSSGCSVFQKTWRTTTGSYKTETVYLHKLIAEKYFGQISNYVPGSKILVLGEQDFSYSLGMQLLLFGCVSLTPPDIRSHLQFVAKRR